MTEKYKKILELVKELCNTNEYNFRKYKWQLEEGAETPTRSEYDIAKEILFLCTSFAPYPDAYEISEIQSRENQAGISFKVLHKSISKVTFNLIAGISTDNDNEFIILLTVTNDGKNRIDFILFEDRTEIEPKV